MVGQWYSLIPMKRWPLYGMYGSTEAEFEVQRTVKRAELTAFLCLLERVIMLSQESVIGPIKVHVDNKAMIDGLRIGEKECIKPRVGGPDLWENWEELHGLAGRGILVEVEHVKVHRTKKGKEENADELAKSGAMLDEGLVAEAKAETMQQEREEVYAAQYAASFHCLVEQWKDCEELRPKPKKCRFSWKRRAIM